MRPWFIFDDFFRLTETTREYHRVRTENNGFIHDLIRDHEKLFKNKTASYETSKVSLDMMYTLRDTMTFEETIEEVLIFKHGAFSTTGKTNASVLLMLAMHQEAQEKVFNEIQSFVHDGNDEVDEEMMSQMNYLDMTIKETLRLFPQALVHFREATKETKLSEKTQPSCVLKLPAFLPF
jgi:cytochrome P450